MAAIDARPSVDRAYLEQIRGLNRGSCSLGEIELMQSEDEIAAALGEIAAARPGEGAPTIGLVYEDPYVCVFRDVVRFRSRRAGTYLRIVARPGLSGDSGAIALVERSGRFLLKRTFRHATRAWELEFPRGFGAAGAAPEETAIREMTEETGYTELAGPPEVLGRIFPDTGLIAHTTAVVLLRITGRRSSALPEDSESIEADEHWVAPDAFLDLAREGRVRDGITLAAWCLYLGRAPR